MRFFDHTWLWALIPWGLLPGVWILLGRRSERLFAKFISNELFSRMIVGDAKSGRRRKFVLLWAVAFFVLIAAARPQAGSREEELKSQGLDVVMVLDVSNSMATEDVVPSRIKKAKHIMKGFLDRMSGDRVGIVAFAGTAVPVAPLTTDYDYLRQILDGIDEHTITNQGTNLKSALQTAIDLIDRGGVNDGPTADSEDTKTNKAVVVISDGEDHEGEETALAERLKKSGTRVYTIGVGSTKGAPIPMRDAHGTLQGYKKDRNGSVVLSKIETKALSALANNGGGKYYNASTDEGEIDEIISDIASLDRVDGAIRRVVVYDEIFQYPLMFAVVLLLLALFISDGKAAATALVVLTLFAPYKSYAADSVEEYQEGRNGVKAYSDGDFAEAVNHFGKAQAAQPDSTRNHFNLGTALLKSGSADTAVSSLKLSVEDLDALAGSRGAYNLGRALEESGGHEEAMAAYQKGLERVQELKGKGPLNEEGAEVEKRLKQALEIVEQKKQQKEQQKSDDDKKEKKPDDKQDQKQQGSGKENDKKDKNEKKKYDIPKEKQKYKAEHLSEQDAKRLMQQLKEQENQTAQKLRQQKAEEIRREGKTQQPEKDW